MGESEFKNRLANMNEGWSEVKDSIGGIPPGIYVLQLQGAEIKEVSTDSDRLRVAFEWLVLEGDRSGEVVYDGMPLHRKDGTPFFSMVVQRIEQLGLEAPEAWEDLPEILDSLVANAPTVQVAITEKDGYTNVKVKSLLSEASPAPEKAGKRQESPPVISVGKKKAKAPIVESEFVEGNVVMFKDDDGNAIHGEITGVNGVIATIMDTDNDEWEIPFSELSLDENAPDEDHADLLGLGLAAGVEGLKDSMQVDEIVEEFKAYSWQASEMTPDEIALFERHDIPVEKVLPPAKKKKTKTKGK